MGSMHRILRTTTVTTLLAWGAFACQGQAPALVDEQAGLDDELAQLTDEDFGRTSRSLTKGTMGATNGDLDYCADPANPCLDGEGDCDRDEDCGPGLVCSPNVGLNYGFSAGIDVCEPDLNGTSGFCSAGDPCGAGEGDCNRDADCLPGHTCEANVGADYGFSPGIDVCEFTALGSQNYCSEAAPCGEGEGDCDFDAECQMGLTCVANVGATYGFTPGVDVCQTSTVGGG